jgi:light-regulated signal transduction histidine kinase (bacteriophytochrome)
MDLISHDVMNNNQAVLSYMDLILSSEDVSEKVKGYASKATTQIRASSMLIDNIRRFMALRDLDPDDIPVTGIKETVDKVAHEVSRFFEMGTVSIESPKLTDTARVRGAGSLEDLLGNVMMNMAQLGTDDRVVIQVDAYPVEEQSSRYWMLTMRSQEAHLPPGVAGDVSSMTDKTDISKMARVSGLFFASKIAGAIGGRLEAGPIDPGTGKGCVCKMMLRRADL